MCKCIDDRYLSTINVKCSLILVIESQGGGGATHAPERSASERLTAVTHKRALHSNLAKVIPATQTHSFSTRLDMIMAGWVQCDQGQEPYVYR